MCFIIHIQLFCVILIFKVQNMKRDAGSLFTITNVYSITLAITKEIYWCNLYAPYS